MFKDKRNACRYTTGFQCWIVDAYGSGARHVGVLVNLSQAGGRVACRSLPELKTFKLIVAGAEDQPIIAHAVRVEKSLLRAKYKIAFVLDHCWPYDLFEQMAYPNALMKVQRVDDPLAEVFR